MIIDIVVSPWGKGKIFEYHSCHGRVNFYFSQNKPLNNSSRHSLIDKPNGGKFYGWTGCIGI